MDVRSEERDRWGVRGLAVGIALGGASTGDEWQRALEWVAWAERHDLHSVWLPEMHFARGANTSPLLCLAAFAAHTRRLRLATTSLLLPIHHPLRIAQQVALLDRLSEGRVILGLGRGFRAPLFSAFGVDPSSKRDRFDESLDLILRAWKGEIVSLAGTRFATGRDTHPYRESTPLQQPHPPLAVAAFGRKGLEQAARRRLPYLASPMETLDMIAENLEFYRAGLPAGSRPDGAVIPVMRTLFVAADDASRARVLENLAGDGRLSRARLPRSIARAVTAPLKERVLVGGVDEVTERLARYRERLGMNLLIVRPQIAGASRTEREDSLARLVEEVLPALR